MERRFLQSTFKKSLLPSLNPFSYFQEFDGARSFFTQEVGSSKRIFDILLAVLLLVVSLPMMALISLLVRLDSPGPIFYAQVRVGLNRRRRERRREARQGVIPAVDRRKHNVYGLTFKVYKFRTMRVDAEANGAVWCRKDDPRVTRVGRVLRKTHLDELPQLLNVVLGDMSIVGPRPERPEFVRRLRDAVPSYEERLNLRPGLTGLAQIRHRADLEISDVRKKVRYDLFYMKRASLWTDVKIVAGTLPLALGLESRQDKNLGRSERPDRPDMRGGERDREVA